MAPRRAFTVVSFHAHPDDEALLTAGTLARAARRGHRVVLVLATAGESGLAEHGAARDVPLGDRRVAELDASAAAIGAARVVFLGYGDSGYEGEAQPDRPAFSRADVDVAAERLAAVLLEEDADVLTIYDPAGGYGHPDHVQVHRVGTRAADLAGTRVLLEATVDRTVLVRVLRLLRLLRPLLPGLDLPDGQGIYRGRDQITHRVDVRDALDAKRASLAAHASQATSTSGVRTLALILRLPGPLYRWAFRNEWFVERGRVPEDPPLDDIFASLR